MGEIIIDLMPKEELPVVAGGAAWSHRRSGLESQEEWPGDKEEWLGVAGGVAWSHKRSPLEIKEELPGVANFVPACFPPF